ncbi:MAG: hypothetical protein RIF32_19530, partial [Leptospirales bacterium]
PKKTLERLPVKATVASVIALGTILLLAIDFDSGEDPAKEALNSRSDDKSLFESGFWLSGNEKSESEELRPAFALLIDETNPRTGRNYTEEEAKKAQYLARLFPENELIPRPDLLGYRESLEERAQRHEATGYEIVGGDASPAEIESYYGHMSKLYADQNELLEYALQHEEVPEEYTRRMEKMLATGHEVLQEIAGQKRRSLDVHAKRLAEGAQ